MFGAVRLEPSGGEITELRGCKFTRAHPSIALTLIVCDVVRMHRTRFFGYPAEPELLGQSIEAAAKALSARLVSHKVETWPQVFRPGEFIDANILGAIDACELAYFDVSLPNFNVFFEAGYSVGRGKPTILLVNSSLEGAGEYLQEIGLFDTVGQARYKNSVDLVDLLAQDKPPRPILPASYQANLAQPLYVLKPKVSFEGMARDVSALTDTHTQFRSFDPAEDARLSLRDAVQHIAESTGVLCAVVSREIQDAENHNLRAAFLSGLSRAMDRELLLLNMSSKPLPLDVRDFAKNGRDIDSIAGLVQSFALTSLARLQRASPQPTNLGTAPVQRISLGGTAAENEIRRLSEYFVETPAYRSAIEGEGRIVIGRKGSGKTAIFSQMANRLSYGRRNVVIALKPDGYQLKKFKDNLIKFLSEVTKEHTVSAFWEYVLLLEICHQGLINDEKFIGRDPSITRIIPKLRDKYGSDEYVLEGDFSERTLLLLNEVERRYRKRSTSGERATFLNRAEVTEVVYSHNINELRSDVMEYLHTKEKVVILIDNLDKGWESHGVSQDDLLMLRTLIEVGRKIERNLARGNVEGFCLVFLRNDIYELLLDNTPDRGKEGKIAVDWRDRDLLKQILRKRIATSGVEGANWGKIAFANVDGHSSLDWVLDRCLMRPRYLIDLVNRCIGSAASKNHSKIEPADFDQGYREFSLDALVSTNLEIRDVRPDYYDAIFALRGLHWKTTRITISLSLLNRGFAEVDHTKIIDLFVWYGVLGALDESGAATFIYDVEYNEHVLEQIRINRDADEELFEINRAFWPALKIDTSKASAAQMPLL